ncbi:hypothetical protein LXA43DRAFT_1111498 [Ganoderma leucocontextum]|nr:hypothetical protein LXA43DRAFT_1111498 [Ganoderma leucocontextum]
MPHSTTQNKPGAGRRGRRFPQEAADIMLSYYHNVSTFPNESARIQLARKVKRVGSRCSHYTAHHVYQYFANLRHRAKYGVEPSLPSDAAVVTTASLDAARCKEPRPSIKAESLRKERLDGRTSAQEVKSHALLRPIQHPSLSSAAEGGEYSLISPARPRRATILKTGETASHDTESENHPPPKTDNLTQLVRVPTSNPASSSAPPSTRHEDEPQIGLPAYQGNPSHLATQLHLALSGSDATPVHRSIREPPPKSFAEMATWLSARRSAVMTLLQLDSALMSRV